MNSVHVSYFKSHAQWVTLYICVKQGYQKNETDYNNNLPWPFLLIFIWYNFCQCGAEKIKSIMKNQMEGENVVPKKIKSIMKK